MLTSVALTPRVLSFSLANNDDAATCSDGVGTALVPTHHPLYDVLASLCDRNLCLERHSGRQRIFQTVDPSQALPNLLQEKQKQFATELQ